VGAFFRTLTLSTILRLLGPIFSLPQTLRGDAQRVVELARRVSQAVAAFSLNDMVKLDKLTADLSR